MNAEGQTEERVCSGLLQQRFIQLPSADSKGLSKCLCIDMNGAMDVIAIAVSPAAGAEGSDVHRQSSTNTELFMLIRSITWEKIYIDTPAEVRRKSIACFDAAIGTNSATASSVRCLKFCPPTNLLKSSNAATKLLSIGYADGSVVVFDIETATGILATRHKLSSSSSSDQLLLCTAWQRLPQHRSNHRSAEHSSGSARAVRLHVWRYGGAQQLLRSGHPAGVIDSNSNNSSSGQTAAVDWRSRSEKRFLFALSGLLQLTIVCAASESTVGDGPASPTQQQWLCGYCLGVYPLFSVCLSSLPMFRPVPSKSLLITPTETLLMSSTESESAASESKCALLAYFVERSRISSDSDSNGQSMASSINTTAAAAITSAAAVDHHCYSGGIHGRHLELRLPADCSLRADLLEKSAALELRLQDELHCCHSIITGCSRKWKEACKVVLPKLELMHSLLQSYQMQGALEGPVDFLFSIACCGLWHPAATSVFQQHWNAQSVNRLRSAVDAASRNIISSMQLPLAAAALNASNICRELCALHEEQQRGADFGRYSSCDTLHCTNSSTATSAAAVDDRGRCSDSVAGALHRLVACSDTLIKHVDRALLEARLARERMLLYAQFTQDCIGLCSPLAAAIDETSSGINSDLADDAETAEKSAAILLLKKNASNWPLYRQMFDPRKRSRAAWTQQQPQQQHGIQAEHVTGTNLYCFLALHQNDAVAAAAVSDSDECIKQQTDWQALWNCNTTATQQQQQQQQNMKAPPLPPSLLQFVRHMKTLAADVLLAVHRSTSAAVATAATTAASHSQRAFLSAKPSARQIPPESAHVRSFRMRCCSGSEDEVCVPFAFVTAAVVSAEDSTPYDESLLLLAYNVSAAAAEEEEAGAASVAYIASVSLKQLTARVNSSFQSISVHKIAMYTRAAADRADAQYLRVLLIVQLTSAQAVSAADEFHLLEFDAQQLQFHKYAAPALPQAAEVAAAAEVRIADVDTDTYDARITSHSWKMRKLPLKCDSECSSSSSIATLCAQGERGMILIAHRSGKLLLIDLEDADEEEEEEKD